MRNLEVSVLTASQVTVRWLVLGFGWVTICGQVKHLGITNSTQGQLCFSSHSAVWGRQIEYQFVWLGLWLGAFTCVEWQVTLRSHMTGDAL